MNDLPYRRSCSYRAALNQALSNAPVQRRSRELVVTRFKEDLAWLACVDPAVCCTVYNKGKSDIAIPCVQVPNVGRDVQTIFLHVSRRFDTLADITYFCQGDPTDRVFGLLEAVEKLQQVQYVDFGTDVLEQNKSGPIQALWLWLFDEPCPKGWTFRACCTLGVSRERVQQRPQEWYEGIERLFRTGGCGIAAESMPYVIEQILWRIFQSTVYNKASNVEP